MGTLLIGLWPPFAAPEGLIAACIAAWLTAIVVGAWMGFRIAARSPARVGAAVGLVVLFGVMLGGWSVFDASRIITFPALDGQAPVTLLLPLVACEGSQDFEPGGRDHDTALPEDVRAAAGAAVCAVPTAGSALAYFILTCAMVFAIAGLLALGLGAVVHDPKIAKLVGVLEGILNRYRGQPS